MVVHESVIAILASVDGRSGHFDVIEDSLGSFIVYDNGSGISFPPHKSLESARAGAQEKADAFDRFKLDVLKSEWKSDPHWDIEDSDGCAVLHDELKLYRFETERDEARSELHRLQTALAAFGSILREVSPQ